MDLDFIEEPPGIPPWDLWIRLNGQRYAFNRPSLRQLALLSEINKLPDEQKPGPLIQLLEQMCSIKSGGLDLITADQAVAIIGAMLDLIDRRAAFRASVLPCRRSGLYDPAELN